MANKVDFTINLKVNGKDQAVQASVAVGDLRDAVEQSRSSLENALQSVNNWGFALHGLQDAVNGIASSLNTLTEESRTFGGAMAAANTMAGKSGDDFQNLKEQVTELSKTIPVARDQLANGLYQVISNGVPEDNWIEYLEKSAKASVGGAAPKVYYDGSKAVDSKASNRYSIFGQLAINELLFLGDEEDDVWGQDEVMEETLKYLNLHIVQEGLRFYIFSWETVKGADRISWRDIAGGTTLTTARQTVDIATGVAACSRPRTTTRPTTSC